MLFRAPRFTSVSQPQFPERGRALTAFIAVATAVCQAEYVHIAARRRLVWSLVGVCLFINVFFGPYATGWMDLIVRALLPLAGLLVLLLLIPGAQVFGSQAAARRYATIRRLDHIRSTVGLEEGLDPGWIGLFEPTARHWETIENGLQSAYWTAHVEDRDALEREIVARIIDTMGVESEGHIVDHVKALNEELKEWKRIVGAEGKQMLIEVEPQSGNADQ